MRLLEVGAVGGKLRTNGEHRAKLCYNILWDAVRRIASRSTLALSAGSIAASNTDEGRSPMDRRLADLLVAIVSYVTTHDGYVTKTKLLKLVYLLDVEFYRTHGKTFTGFRWKYFHLGPWTKEFNPLLDILVAQGALIENSSTRADYDTKLLRASETIDLRKPFDTYRDEAILKALLDTWGPSGTGEILDYVYFRTEPMEHGVRSEDLDFSKVLPQTPEAYKRSASADTSGELSRARRELAQKMSAPRPESIFDFTAPTYDDEFHAAMEKLDSNQV